MDQKKESQPLKELLLETYDYNLARSQIAQFPVENRENSRLMVVAPDGLFQHLHFHQIAGFFRSGDIIVVNETKVTGFCLDGSKEGTNTKVSCLFKEEIKPGQHIYSIIAKPLRRLKPDTIVNFSNGFSGLIVEKDLNGCVIQLRSNTPDKSIDELIRIHARPPLPPYIVRSECSNATTVEDWQRYQTVYARSDGSIAAPTAGLHFTSQLLTELCENGIEIYPINLKIGEGTFRPIRENDITKHKMDREHYSINSDVMQKIVMARENRRRLFVVGTTVVRALESAFRNEKTPILKGSTDLFIYPGYRFKLPYSGLITNFHLPKSTLFLLVSAFGGTKRLKKAYSEAIARGYRFYSYGDAMLLFSPDDHTRDEIDTV